MPPVAEHSHASFTPPAAAAPRAAPAPPPDARSRDLTAWLLVHASGPLTCGLADAAHTLVTCEGWAPFGYARLADLAHERLGRSGRWVSELAVLGRVLAAQPALRAAIVGGDGAPPLGRAAALAIARAGGGQPIDHWIAMAREVTIRELQTAIRAERHGAPGANALEAANGDADGMHAGDPASGGAASDDEDEDSRVHVQFELPRWAHACFVEALDLHRAVSGHEATVSSFIEALAAEAAAGAHPPDVTLQRLRRGIPAAIAEAALARVNHRWRELRRASADVASTSSRTVATVEAMARSPAAADHASAHRNASAAVSPPDAAGARGDSTRREVVAGDAMRRLEFLVRAEDRVERQLGELLGMMARHGDWTTLGFASAAHYACERLGMPRRTAESRIAAVNAMRRLPVVRNAYRRGDIGLEAAMLLSRMLGAGTSELVQRRWVEQARRVTIKRLRDEAQMAHTRAGAWAPEPAADASNQDTDTASRSGQCPEPASDREWHAALNRPPGRTRRRISGCMPPWNDDTPTSVLNLADVFLRVRLDRPVAELFLAAVESERRRLTAEADAMDGRERDALDGRERVDAARVSLRVAQVFTARCRRVPAWVGLLALLEDYAHTWDDPAAFPKRRWHRTYELANWRCMAPGCTSRRWHDDHHIQYRNRGGSDEPWNQLCLCRFHHQQGEHGRFARVRGRAPIDVVWRLGTRALATWYRNEMRLGL